LQQIPMADRLNEMEFFFAVDKLSPSLLREVLSDSAYQDVAKGLSFPAFKGLMQGFIDLVFRHNNKYYIVDYKSNYLGDSIGHYSQAALAKAMRSHRYDLQYLTYTVALHRFLQNKLPGYQYRGRLMHTFLRNAQQLGDLRLFDLQFAQHLLTINGDEPPELLLAAALVSNRLSHGDTCLALDWVGESNLYKNPELRVVRQKLPSLIDTIDCIWRSTGTLNNR